MVALRYIFIRTGPLPVRGLGVCACVCVCVCECVCMCACVCVLRRRLSRQGCLRPGDSPAPSSRGHPANWSNWSKRKPPRIIMIALYYIIIRTGLLPVRGLAGSFPSSRNVTVVSPDRRRRVSRWNPPPRSGDSARQILVKLVLLVKYWSNWYCWSNTGQNGYKAQPHANPQNTETSPQVYHSV